MGRSALGRPSGHAGLSAAPRRSVAAAGFAPSGSSSPMRRRGSRGGLRQQIGVDCQSMPTSHAAVRHGVSWGKARRAEQAFLAEWDRTRPKRQPRHIGLDEIQRGKGQRFWTVLSDVVHGEVIGLRQDRTEAAATALLTEELTGRQRAAITAVCTDMHRPYLNAVGAVLPARGDRVRQIPRAPARECGARRCSATGILSRRRGDAGARPRETLALAAALEDGARVEARGAPDVVCRESAVVQSVCPA